MNCVVLFEDIRKAAAAHRSPPDATLEDVVPTDFTCDCVLDNTYISVFELLTSLYLLLFRRKKCTTEQWVKRRRRAALG
ncbi:unnamed protein product [Arctia plantaginis]|uniref:Uncharacterized protein n=1 Tax=Arctia plantaginis TaxID=874455 RepID=A0A8S1B8S1_ARCPL|nr:unnamed protein product [Arctia plantaginis]